MSAFAFAETCVFGKQSLEPMSCGLLAPWRDASKLLRLPFFRRYGVNLPSSLTEGRSCTWGEFPLPTSVGVRYGQSLFWVEAFLGGIGVDDFRVLADTRDRRQAACERDLPRSRPSLGQPSLSICWVHLPDRVPPSLITSRSGAGLSHLLSIAYDVMSSA